MNNDDRELSELFEAENRQFDDRREFAEALLQRIGRERRIRTAVLATAVVVGGVFAAAPMFQALIIVIEISGALVGELLRQPVDTQLRVLAALSLPFVATGLFRWLER